MLTVTPEMISAALAVADEFERDLNLGDRGARSVVRQMLQAALAVAPTPVSDEITIVYDPGGIEVGHALAEIFRLRGSPCS